MENLTKSIFKFSGIHKCLPLTVIVMLFISCEKDNLTESYSFQDYLFTENVNCYDTLGNQFDSLSYMFSRKDFIYNDEFHIPYKNIEIVENNAFIINYVSKGILKTLKGVIDRQNDSLYFYEDKIGPNNLLLKGLFIDNQLRIAGCGYIFYTYIEDGGLRVINKSKTTTLKLPKKESLLKYFPNHRLNNKKGNRYLYFQRFDLIYKKTSE